MLSRIADSLFWMARYMDRAENAARLLDVTYHMLLEQAHHTYELRWDAVIRSPADNNCFSARTKRPTPTRSASFCCSATIIRTRL